MKTKGYSGRSDGQVSGPLAGLVVGVVVLFVGLFVVSTVSDAIPGLQINAFTTASNTTAILTGSVAGNNTYGITVGHIVDITEDYIVVSVRNTTDNPAYNINVSLNKIHIRNIAVPVSSSVTNITGVTLISSAINNLTFGNETTPNSTMIVNASIVYASSLVNTDMGDISDSLVTSTGTIFSVLGIVIIIVALTMAIQSLQKESSF